MPAAWWKGARGEWLVAGQAVLMALVFLGPRTIGGWPPWPFPLPAVSRGVGAALMAVGGILFLAGILRLGRSLTPLPYPREGGELVRTGRYALVRHPIYAGGIALALGWALVIQGWLTLVSAAALFALLDAKSRREEAWLDEKFPAYADYRRRVKKLVPFVY